MKWICSFFILFFAVEVSASENCFIAKENGVVLKESGDCKSRRSPCSTFKIPLALMAFDSKMVNSSKDTSITLSNDVKQKMDEGRYFFPKGHPLLKLWAKVNTPKDWMKYSAVWYSQEITKKLGMQKFQQYVDAFDYGNKDITGNKGENNGLTASWLAKSSLKISPREQVDFLEKLTNRSIGVSAAVHNNTIEILSLEDIYDGWKLYGKTGSGTTFGWFVGWVEKGDRRIIFAQYANQIKDSPIGVSKIAKELSKDNLLELLLD